MTNKEFFVRVLKEEEPKFEKVLQAIPGDKLSYKPNEVARDAGRVSFQLATQPFFITAIIQKGAPDWSTYREHTAPSMAEILPLMKKNFTDLYAALAAVSDEEWENGKALLEYPGGKWETKKYDMAWGFLFDAIHHRGQLTTYLRAMGAKVPAVYGNSADERPLT